MAVRSLKATWAAMLLAIDVGGTVQGTYHLSDVPVLRNRLLQIPEEKRVGPVIVSTETGLPFHGRTWASKFRRYAKLAGVPDEIQMRDARAVAATEAELEGVDASQIQKMMRHANLPTTQIYLRGEDRVAQNVIQLRQRGSKVANS